MEIPFTGRREDRRLITGAGRYTADHELPGQTHAVFLRSDHAHAEFEVTDISEAMAAPGVLSVYTGADMEKAGYRRARPPMPFTGPETPFLVPDATILAVDRVRYVGEPIAMIVAETRQQALEAGELVALDFTPLPVAAHSVEALEKGAPQLHAAVPGNLSLDLPFGDTDAVAEAFGAAAHVVRLDLVSGRVFGAPMEPKAALASWDGTGLDLWCPSQGISGLRPALAAALGLSPDQVRPHAEDVGGAFGTRGQTYPEYLALCHAARALGRPVRWDATRSETMVSDCQGRGISMTVEMALDANGRFLALRHDWIGDMGAWLTPSGPLTVVGNALIMASGAYRIPAVSGRVRLALTNLVPTCPYRGAGRPDMAYAVERIVDEAARACGLDRMEIRCRNMLPAEAFPWRIPTTAHASYDSADFANLLETARKAADWDSFAERRKAAAAQGLLRGIGCALFIEPAGGVSPVDEAAMTFDPDGAVILHGVATASGQGHETVFPEIAARVLGVPPERITYRGGAADSPSLKGGGAFGSRTGMVFGSVTDAVARVVLEKARALASRVLEADAEALVYADGLFTLPGTNRSTDLAELARSHPGALDSRAELPTRSAFPSGAHVAEVAIDPDTGVTQIIRYTAVDDCGTVLNPTLVEGQIWGGLTQGLGQVLGELCLYDESGQLLSGSFMDYPMPRADMLIHVDLSMAGTASPSNPLGAKGVGEAGTVGALPTGMNAILDALRPAGVTHLDMPATPARIWTALQQARSRE